MRLMLGRPADYRRCPWPFWASLLDSLWVRVYVCLEKTASSEELCSGAQLAMDKGSFRTGGLARGAPNLGRILTVALQVASAMAYMHVRVILHPPPTSPFFRPVAWQIMPTRS